MLACGLVALPHVQQRGVLVCHMLVRVPHVKICDLASVASNPLTSPKLYAMC